MDVDGITLVMRQSLLPTIGVLPPVQARSVTETLRIRRHNDSEVFDRTLTPLHSGQWAAENIPCVMIFMKPDG